MYLSEGLLGKAEPEGVLFLEENRFFRSKLSCYEYKLL